MENKFPCPKCGSYDIEISYATISGLDMPTAVYGFTKYDYTVISAEILDINGFSSLNPIIK